MARDYTKYLTWIANEFLPRELATPNAVIQQQVENAITYYNTHSAYKITGIYDYIPGQKRAQLNSAFKTVVEVLPTSSTTWIWNDHPLWTLTGVTILDNVTTDLIMMSEAFRNYRIYVGTNFRWTFEKSDVPTVGGYLYAINVPANVEGVYVIGTKRITVDEDVVVEVILNWINYYTKALVKQIEGNTLRAAGIVDLKTDGQELVNEGKEEMKALQDSLMKESFWVTALKRY
jgi:hypothetical protein